MAVESIDLTDADKAAVVRAAYAELFTYGPLDDLLLDETVTTIVLDGMDKASVRRRHGELEPLGPIFEGNEHLNRIVHRLLRDGRADLSPEMPLIEVGLRVNDRNLCVNVAAPPVTLQLSVDMRLHPVQAPTLDDLVLAGVMPQAAADVLMALARSPYGLVVVGDTESGKTILLGVMAALAGSQHKQMVAVERAGELILPENIQRFTVQWPYEEQPGITFADQVLTALEQSPDLLLLDEVRADEAPAVAPLLTSDISPRQMWAFRGSADSRRLAAALGMLARRSDTTQGEAIVLALYERLPFVVTLRRRRERLLLYGIGEWHPRADQEYPDYVELMTMGWEGLERTGKQPSRPLDLPEIFWLVD